MTLKNTIKYNYKTPGGSISLVDILQQRAQNQSEQKAYIFLENGETESGSITYGELNRKAIAIAANLQSWRGERALLLYPSGLEFIMAFFSCLYGGIVAVSVDPPRHNQKLSQLLSIANDAQAKIALTTRSILADINRRWEQKPELLADLKWVTTDTIEANPQEFFPQSVAPESLVFLQYTSGNVVGHDELELSKPSTGDSQTGFGVRETTSNSEVQLMDSHPSGLAKAPEKITESYIQDWLRIRLAHYLKVSPHQINMDEWMNRWLPKD